VRYWDGTSWTGYQAPKPKVVPPKPPYATLPLVAAVSTLAVLALSLTGSRVVLELLAGFRWPVLVYVTISVVLGYGPVLAFCRYVSAKWGTGHLSDDLGFRFRRSDAGWGPLTWLCCWVAQVVVGIVIYLTGIPTKSNTEGLDELSGERGVLIALLVSAVIAAPFVEELAFRGVVLKGFVSVMPVWVAIVGQGVLFGVAHVGPERGIGNVGLVLILSAVGVVLGGAAYLLRRIGPAIIAHGILNAVALTLVLLLG
jgi:uncharacterized protein